jgi:hypothetical protein
MEGYYYNPRLRESIRIIEHRNDVIVKGLFSDSRLVRFNKINKNTYEDRYGNLLICEDRNTIKIKRWRTRDYIRFDKVDDHRGRSDWHRYHDYDDICDDRYDHYHGYRDDDRYRGSKYDRDDIRKNPEYTSRSRIIPIDRLVGTWEVIHGNFNDVAIIDTRDGLKAKFSGTTNWVSYIKSTTRKNEYLDDRGNRYVFDDDRFAKWYPADKGKTVIEMRKVSSEVRY